MVIPFSLSPQRAVKEAMARSNPIDDLLEMAVELHDLELKYGMTSAVFFEKYQRGEMGDAMPFIHWAGRYQMYNVSASKTRRRKN